MKRYLIFAIFFLMGMVTFAQITNVCGNDTVILQVDNYVDGVIEWQESIDNNSWATIPEVSGALYKFMPKENKYYRAVVKTSTCDPLYSAVSFVQLPPIANAGTDRIIGDTNMTLLANIDANVSGIWSIIEGNNGTLSDKTFANSNFSGIYNQQYKLLWTVTNACGQAKDTVMIEFKEIKAKNNFIIVDNTDSIYSDSTDLSWGVYKIKFSDSTIVASDSIILIGVRSDMSFLRKVYGFNKSISKNIYSFYTEQATFEDIITSGTVNIGDAVNQSITQGTLKSYSPFPTRNTIKNNSDNKGLLMLYASSTNDNSESNSLKSGQEGLTMKLPDVTIFKDKKETIKLSIEDASVTLEPHIVCDVDYSFPASLHNLRLGLDNASFGYSFKKKIVGKAPINFLESEKSLNKVSQCIVFMAGPVPVIVTANFEIKASCNLSISAGIEYEDEVNYRKNLTALVVGQDVKNLSLVTNSTETSTHKVNFVIRDKLTTEFKIGPEISLKIYDFIGPYFSFPLKVEANLCVNTQANWDADAKVSLPASLGAKAKILGQTLFDFKYDIIKPEAAITMPFKINILSGNFQTGKAGTVLPKSLVIQVLSNAGFGVPFANVHFELENGNGTVTSGTILTDILGKVSNNWTLGQNQTNKLKVSVLDCNNKDIENSPLFLYANTNTAPFNCTNTDLNIQLKTKQSNLFPEVTGGKAPYQYSLDGKLFNQQIPMFPISTSGTFLVYVKDQNQCTVNRSFTNKVLSSCTNSKLSLDIFTQANTLTLTGKNGKAPYQFSLDNQNSYSTNNYYSNLSAGTHSLYVKDANSCTSSANIVVDANLIPAIKAIYPLDNSSNIPTSITLKWQAGNYANNQMYDLYLKYALDEFGESYSEDSLIASNLTSSSYTFQKLTYGKRYKWKIVVKDKNGIIKDNNEFSFETKWNNSTSISIPSLLSPQNAEIVIGTIVEMKWDYQEGDFAVYLDDKNASTQVTSKAYNCSNWALNLVPGKKYYWKVKVTNRNTGISMFSPVWSFTCKPYPTSTISDIEGNTYKTVTIGKQTWMAENLKTTRFNDSTSIQLTTDNTLWQNLLTPSYCWYNNDKTNQGTIYGALYNGYTVSGTKNVCPIGWHVPSYDEWFNFFYSFGSVDYADEFLKEAGSVHWLTNNAEATNEASFTALPGGLRNPLGFVELGSSANWWTSNNSSAHITSLAQNIPPINVDVSSCELNFGNSIRCIKDAGSVVVGMPTVVIDSIYSITGNSATCSFHGFNTDGSALLSGLGIVYGTSSEPPSNSFNYPLSDGSGKYNYTIANLTINTMYNVWPFADVNGNIIYGEKKSFVPTILNKTIPEIYTNYSPTTVSYTTATIGGLISSDGGSPVTKRGFCWSTNFEPTISDSVSNNGTGIGAFSSNILNLIPNMTYYLKAYAINAVGTSYGNKIAILPKSIIATITPKVENCTKVLSGATIDSNCGITILKKGVCWSTNPNPTINNNKTIDGSGTGTFSSIISGLSPGTFYYVRSYAISDIWTTYGQELTVVTPNQSIANISTLNLSNIVSTSANSGGKILNNGGAQITEKGVCWSTNAQPTINDLRTIDGIGDNDFTSSITGLSNNTKYYVRAYATNSFGTAYGEEMSFIARNTVSDIEGNIYPFVQIGTQTWMAKDIKSTLYNDGSTIPNSNYWEYYFDISIDGSTKGRIYNYNAVFSNKLCPLGWHVPSDVEWSVLIDYVGGELVAGGKLKSTNDYWCTPNVGATDEFGFSALPCGFYLTNTYKNLGSDGLWWSSTEYDSMKIYMRHLSCKSNTIDKDINLWSGTKTGTFGASVRCVKD